MSTVPAIPLPFGHLRRRARGPVAPVDGRPLVKTSVLHLLSVKRDVISERRGVTETDVAALFLIAVGLILVVYLWGPRA